jgi:hypothetical protein
LKRFAHTSSELIEPRTCTFAQPGPSLKLHSGDLAGPAFLEPVALGRIQHLDSGGTTVPSLRKRQRVLAFLLGLGLCGTAPAATAAENLVFVSGAFRRSIPVADLEFLAATGQPRGLLADVLRLGGQRPADVAGLLNQSATLPVVLVSRLLHTRIGDALLHRLARIIYPLYAREVGIQALRSALVLGIEQGDGRISVITFLRAYPNRNMEINLPALMALMQRASSIGDLVRFFSESPLDGLRGEPAPTPPGGGS